MTHLIEVKNLTKIFQRGSEKLHALDGISFSIETGDIVVITGESGSGKTTLVNLIGCLDNPTSGELFIDDNKIFGKGKELSESELTSIRRRIFGYIFQKFFLIPTLSVQENILLPTIFQSNLKISKKEVDNIMDTLGILKRKNHLPSQLSGGEMQRVAIARALVSKPKILIADEPTGNLDSRHSNEIKTLLIELNKKYGITIILVTHNSELASIGNRTIKLMDGKIQNKV